MFLFWRVCLVLPAFIGPLIVCFFLSGRFPLVLEFVYG